MASLKVTADKILAYTLVVWAFSLAFGPAAELGWIYLGSAIVLGGIFTWFAVELRRDPTPKRAMRLFSWSITYTVLLFGAMALDVLV